MRRAKILANRLSVYLLFILIPFVLWKVYTDNTEQKIRHLKNGLEDIERVQKYTSSKLELISHGLEKLAKINHTKQEISSIRNIKKSLTSISFPGKPCMI
jgi:cell shape-determining protein MreC